MGVHRPRRGLIPRRNWAALVCEAVGYRGETSWDTSRPDGQPVRSERAVAVNIEIMRAFVEIRRAAADFIEIEKRLEELQKKTDGKLAKHEKHLLAIYKALKELAAPLPPQPKHPTVRDTSRPDGQPVRYLDASKARERERIPTTESLEQIDRRPSVAIGSS